MKRLNIPSPDPAQSIWTIILKFGLEIWIQPVLAASLAKDACLDLLSAAKLHISNNKGKSKGFYDLYKYKKENKEKKSNLKLKL